MHRLGAYVFFFKKIHHVQPMDLYIFGNCGKLKINRQIDFSFSSHVLFHNYATWAPQRHLENTVSAFTFTPTERQGCLLTNIQSRARGRITARGPWRLILRTFHNNPLIALNPVRLENTTRKVHVGYCKLIFMLSLR